MVENYRYEKAKEDDPETVNEITFANVYTPDPVSVSITGNKIFKDHDGKELKANADQFQFELYEAADVSYAIEGVTPVTVKNDADGNFKFDLEIETVGTKYYVVKETSVEDSEINYSQEVYYVTVNVANNNGTLVPTVVVKNAQDETVDSDKLTFTNTKEAPKIPDPITVTLNVEKELKNLGGGKLDLRNFMVELVDASDESVEGTKPFDSKTGKTYFTIRFTNAHAGGTYKYILREVDTDVDGVVYSTKEYEIKITVTANNGELTAQVWVDGKKVTDVNKLTFEFTNIYRDPGDPYVPKDPTKPSSPDTGDEGSGLWLIMLVLSSFGFVMTAFGALRRRRRAR